ncbi:MAG: B12-binding domain-containing radical SAM protein [Deltaproteobacteria bacterium CG11_big_fil_rev_8_21_14_0_20_49_13]|nr:MAG: B12-binding domain-containing radical SAM protein [Deltaproteobacteria bacterium CG11_big_fil_rev_8_21_14_0_20_49_13]
MTIVSQKTIDQLLSKVRRPSRYIGGEVNSYNKPWDSAHVKWCLVFPDAYEIGMSHIGLQIIYDALNSEEGLLADRAFAPWLDMEAAMRELNVPMWGLESKRPLKEFDIIGITLPYELTYTNILTMLDLAGIPFYAKDRGEEYPLIIGGGVGAFNPEPVAPFFDAIVLGDGERTAVEISKTKNEGRTTNDELLGKLSKIRGVYVPNRGEENRGQRSEVRKIQKAIVADIDGSHFPKKWVVPFMKIVHDRVGVEIQRGCNRGCRFCQAGYIYRPVRQRSPETIKELACEGLDLTGNEELSFISLSAGDYEGLGNIVKEVSERESGRWTNINLPSLRVETLTPELLSVLKRSLHGGFTIAPEAATERLRNVINKQNTEEELLKTVETVFKTGWRQLKLYFMIGLPTETIDDVRAIADLVLKAYDAGRRIRHDITITASVSTFVPKSHTPFQWARQLTLEETLERQNLLKKLIPKKRGLELKWHGAKLSLLEGAFSRGDRRLAERIVSAWNKGSRFDAWDECFKFENWADIDFTDYLRERSTDEELPWDHLFAGLDRDFLKSEYQKSLNAEVTPDCINNKCTNCGVCDFKDVKNVIVCHCDLSVLSTAKQSSALDCFGGAPRNDNITQLNFTFIKTGVMRWVSHLELMHLFRRAFRRAGVLVKYSQGFNPHMKLSLERALKVGEEGLQEKGKVEISDAGNLDELMNKIELPDGIRITGYSASTR